jgi:hypothetical protein
MAADSQVAQENQLPGSSDWLWTGSISDDLEGFTRDISSNIGGVVQFSVNTTSTNWQIDIYRIGYYQGLGGRLVESLPQTAASIQPPPAVVDLSTGLVDAGNWSITATWAVPTTAVSGIYLAKLTRAENDEQFVIPFVIRDDANYHDILFQTSDTTWAAYTGWGGYNFYGPSPGTAPLASSSGDGKGRGQAYKVSYNRPFTNMKLADDWGLYGGPQDSFFGAESAAVQWLEQMGYDVAYQAGVDTDRYGVRNCRVFIDAGHDEYWSAAQRANVEGARDRGVNLMFWSGNECFWHTRWEDNHRTLVCYKDTWAGALIDPTGEWTGTWMDPGQPGGAKQQNAMTGQLYMVDGPDNDTISVPSPFNLDPFWAGTAVGNGSQVTLAPGTLGYEWDECPDDAFTPPGIVRLSLSTVNVTSLVNDGKGAATGPGTATHSLSLYQAPSGALVFGAGTVFFPWMLSNLYILPDGNPVVGDPAMGGVWSASGTDPSVQAAMINLLTRMGVSHP